MTQTLKMNSQSRMNCRDSSHTACALTFLVTFPRAVIEVGILKSSLKPFVMNTSVFSPGEGLAFFNSELKVVCPLCEDDKRREFAKDPRGSHWVPRGKVSHKFPTSSEWARRIRVYFEAFTMVQRSAKVLKVRAAAKVSNSLARIASLLICVRNGQITG